MNDSERDQTPKPPILDEWGEALPSLEARLRELQERFEDLGINPTELCVRQPDGGWIKYDLTDEHPPERIEPRASGGDRGGQP